ncbi:WD40 repeat domain-containing protein [Nonomuraea sp. NPDC049655]|uniref:WD40 repeat domain-containing protein n=1 Tax=Nonomuraea sp. NPDC049655 TaxID=3364355 RepID=UPI0037BDB507
MVIAIVVAVAVLSAATAALVANRPMSRAAADRFSARQQVAFTAFNGPAMLRHMQVTRRFRWAGASAGTVLMALPPVSGDLGLRLFLPVGGWTLGVLAGELSKGGGPRPRTLRAPRRGVGSRPLVILWRICAALSCGVALHVVARSFLGDVGFAGRAAAAWTLAVVVIVQAVLHDLGRPLAQGPADLVAAEAAMRSDTARMLMAGGSAAALWAAPLSELPGLHDDLLLLSHVAVRGLPLLVWILSGRPRPGVPGRWRVPWRAVSAALVTVCLIMAWNGLVVWRYSSPPPPAALTGPLPAPIGYADQSHHRWRLHLRRSGSWQTVALPQARAVMPISNRRAPLVISGDGYRLIYLDAATGRLVLHDLSAENAPRPLTGPGEGVPDAAFGQDDRHVILTWPDGVDLVDAVTGARRRLPGIGRVIDVVPGKVVATTGRRALEGAPDTELVTLDARGAVRTRTPFDPALQALLTPDGDRLVLFSENEVLTMDPRTGGRVRARATLGGPGVEAELVRWTEDGRLLVMLGWDDPVLYLVDLETGKSRQVKNVPSRLGEVVVGRLA